jgi:hypothetical protein
MSYRSLIVKNDIQKGTVDLATLLVVTVILNEAQFPELVHKEVHPAARCTHQFG